MRLLYLFVLSMLFCCTCVLGAQEPSPPDAQALSKPVTLAVKGEALSDIADMLSKQVGTAVRVARDIADRKVTVLVDKRLFKDVLNELEAIFGCRWSIVKSSSGVTIYEIAEPQKARLAREAAMKSAEDAVWEEWEARIRQAIQMSVTGDRKKMSDIYKQMAMKREMTDEDRLQYGLYAAASDIGSCIGRLYLSLPPESREMLRSGCEIYFDTETSEPQYRIPKAIADDITTKLADWPHTPKPTGSYNFEIDASVSDGQLLSQPCCSQYTLDKDGKWKPGGAMGGALCSPVVVPKARPTYPQTKLPRQGDDSILDKQTSFTARELADEADLFGQTESSPHIYAGRSDILSLLHRKLGLQVISDHYMGWAEYKPGEPVTARQMLTGEWDTRSAEAKAFPWHGYFDTYKPRPAPDWGWDGSCLYIREQYPYELTAGEVPNRLLKLWRAHYAQRQYFDLDDTAGIDSLTDERSASWQRNWGRLIKVRGTDYSHAEYPTIGCTSEFKFYGGLSDSQKRRVLSDGLRVQDLSLAQVDLLVQCIPEAEESQKASDSQLRRVGIYKGRFRVDRPGADSVMPASVRIDRRPSQNYALFIDSPFGKQITAMSPEDALSQFRKQHPGLDKNPYFLGRDAGYILTLQFPDGTTKELPIMLYEPAQTTENTPPTRSPATGNKE